MGVVNTPEAVVSIKLFINEEPALLDLSDYDMLAGDELLMRRRTQYSEKVATRFARAIAGASDGQLVRHINGRRNDFRKMNLEIQP